MIKEINILGAVYSIKITDNDSLLENKENIAECHNFQKTIIVTTKDSSNKVVPKQTQDELWAHELAHAFLYQIGSEDINDERHANLLGMFVMFIKNNKVYD